MDSSTTHQRREIRLDSRHPGLHHSVPWRLQNKLQPSMTLKFAFVVLGICKCLHCQCQHVFEHHYSCLLMDSVLALPEIINSTLFFFMHSSQPMKIYKKYKDIWIIQNSRYISFVWLSIGYQVCECIYEYVCIYRVKNVTHTFSLFSSFLSVKSQLKNFH